MPNAIGIDLGTKYCRAAYQAQQRLQLIPNAQDELATPIIIGLAHNGQVTMGREAQSAHDLSSTKPLTRIKGLLATPDRIWFGSQQYAPLELAAVLFRAVRKDAEKQLLNPVTQAVVCVPALAGNVRRSATRDAAHLAGFTEIKLLSEPTAVALAYTQQLRATQRLLIYGLGAGYFETTIVEYASQTIKTLGTEGDENIGGYTFDNTIANYFLTQIKQEYGVDYSTDSHALWLVTRAAEEAKIKLSTAQHTDFVIPKLANKNSRKGLDVDLSLSRVQLEAMLAPSIDLTLSLVYKVLDLARLTIADIDVLLLVGGSTRLPIVQQRLYEALDKSPTLGVDDLVAFGAALQAASIERQLLHTPEPTEQQRNFTGAPPEERRVAPKPLTKTEEVQNLPDRVQPANEPIPSQLLNEVSQFLHQGQFEQAIILLQRLEQLIPPNAEISTLLAKAYYGKGVQLANAGQWIEAIQALERGATYEHSHTKIRDTLVLVYQHYAAQLFQAGQWEVTATILEKALRCDPTNKALLHDFVSVCLERGKILKKAQRFPEAAAILRKGLYYAPQNSELKILLAQLAPMLKQRKESRKRR